MNLNARNEHTVKDTLKLLEARRASGEYASNQFTSVDSREVKGSGYRAARQAAQTSIDESDDFDEDSARVAKYRRQIIGQGI